ncbi:MAG: ComF family protein, partial [Nitrospira sp.]|nr:ComF family protein [Nitrospira sp.]
MGNRILEWMPSLVRRTIRFVLPAHCSICGCLLTGDPTPHFCAGCWSTIALMPAARCSRCDRPFPSTIATAYSPSHVCYTCAEHPPSYTRAWTLYPYTTPLREAICLFKYRGKVSLASPLATLMVERLPLLDRVSVIMPVPLHSERLRQREFNQSLLLADQIGRVLGIPVSYTNLIRTIPSPAQTTLSRKSRLKNLRGAFVVRYPDEIKKQRVLLIDDVFTTGTTVNECAKSLRKAGSSDVLVLTLGRTLDRDLIP